MINIPEKFWPNYKKFSDYYDEGEKYFDKKQYTKSFELLKNFITKDKEIQDYSFYNSARKLIPKAINGFISKKESEYKILSLELKESLNEPKITKLDSIYNSIDNGKELFSPYFKSSDSESITLNQKIDSLQNNTSIILEKSKNDYKDKMLSLFQIENYDVHKFKLFIDLLTKILCHSDFIKKIDELDTLNLKYLDKYNSLKEELVDLHWLDDFYITIKLINENIKNDNFMFNDETIQNLENRKDKEKQPYYDIIMAFHLLSKDELDDFAKYIKQAFNKCTDIELLFNLELLYISYQVTKESIEANALKYINNGLEFENNGLYEKAKSEYERASKMTTFFAPPLFYLGRIYHKEGNYASSEIFLDKALNIYPEYIEPRCYKIISLIDNGNLNEALSNVNSALENNQIWYFYYQKALILYKLNNFNEAKNIILDNCIQLNSYNFDQFILLGDIYVSLEDYNNAGESYKKAGNLEPTNSTFIKKIEELNQLIQNINR